MPSTFGLRRARADEIEERTNPWLTLDDASLEPSRPQPPNGFRPPEIRPNPGVAPPAVDHRLPTRAIDACELSIGLWWIGAHGGAGETTLASLTDNTRAAAHTWPLGAGYGPREVVLLGRTSYDGLCAVRHALAHWGSGQLAVRLRGLVLLADAPGKLPAPLRDFVRVLQQGAPGPACLIPWQPSWRLGAAEASHVRKHLKPIINQEETQ